MTVGGHSSLTAAPETDAFPSQLRYLRQLDRENVVNKHAIL